MPKDLVLPVTAPSPCSKCVPPGSPCFTAVVRFRGQDEVRWWREGPTAIFSHMSRSLSVAALAFLVGACAPRGPVATTPISVPGVRTVDVSSGANVDFDALVSSVGSADVVFFGEQHDDPETHRVEFGLLDALSRTGRPVILSLEM